MRHLVQQSLTRCLFVLALIGTTASCRADEDAPAGIGSNRADATTEAVSAPPGSSSSPGAPLDPGAYVLAAVGRHDMPLAVVDVPEGFRSSGDFVVGEEGGAFGSVGYFKASGVDQDPCTKEGRKRLGPSVDDLAAALASQAMLSPTTPVPVSIGSHEGVYLKMTSPPLYSQCTFHDVTFWTGEGGDRGPWTSVAGTRVGVWILDVDGNRGVINAFAEPGTTPERADAPAAIVEPVRFTPPDGAPIP